MAGYRAYEEWGRAAKAQGEWFWDRKRKEAQRAALKAMNEKLARIVEDEAYKKERLAYLEARFSFEKVARVMYGVDRFSYSDDGKLVIRLMFEDGDVMTIEVTGEGLGRWGAALEKLMETRK